MNIWVRRTCSALGLMWAIWIAAPVQAQIPAYQMDRSKMPAFSPYLNLLRGGSSPAINYYGIVRPEVAFANSINQLDIQQNLLQLQQTANQQNALAAYTQLPTTGHASGFMTQSRYFQTNGTPGLFGNNFAPGGFGMGPQLPAGNMGNLGNMAPKR